MLKQDIATWSLNFNNCNNCKHGPDARQDLHPLPIVRPGERYHLDQIVMTNPSAHGHTSILTLRDAGSRFLWFAPCSTISTGHWFSVVGVPRQLTADNKFSAFT